MGDYYDIYVLTTDTDHGKTEPYPEVKAGEWIFNDSLKCHINYLAKKSLRIRQIIREIRKSNADFIYLNHLFSPYFVIAPLAYRLFNKTRAKWIVCPRGALFPSALNHKRFKKLPVMWLYRLFRLSSKVIFHATTPEEAEVIRQHFSKPLIRLAGNIPDLMQPNFRPIEKKKDELVCLFVARIVPIKNLLFLLDTLAKINNVYKVSVEIIGPKEDTEYWNTCLNQIRQLPSNIETIDCGPLPTSDISGHLFKSHLYVLPTLGENFGHSIFSALLHGRPVLISDRTPWRQLNERQAGWDLPLEQPEAFVRTIESVAAADQNQYDVWANGAWEMAQAHILSTGWNKEYQSLFA